MSTDIILLLIVILLLLVGIIWGLVWVAARMDKNHRQLLSVTIVQSRSTRSTLHRSSRGSQSTGSAVPPAVPPRGPSGLGG